MINPFFVFLDSEIHLLEHFVLDLYFAKRLKFNHRFARYVSTMVFFMSSIEAITVLFGHSLLLSLLEDCKTPTSG